MLSSSFPLPFLYLIYGVVTATQAESDDDLLDVFFNNIESPQNEPENMSVTEPIDVEDDEFLNCSVEVLLSQDRKNSATPSSPSSSSSHSPSSSPSSPTSPSTPASSTLTTSPTILPTPSTSTPSTQSTPLTPATQSIPSTPTTPSTPSTPSTPATPSISATSAPPATPATTPTPLASGSQSGTPAPKPLPEKGPSSNKTHRLSGHSLVPLPTQTTSVSSKNISSNTLKTPEIAKNAQKTSQTQPRSQTASTSQSKPSTPVSRELIPIAKKPATPAQTPKTGEKRKSADTPNTTRTPSSTNKSHSSSKTPTKKMKATTPHQTPTQPRLLPSEPPMMQLSLIDSLSPIPTPVNANNTSHTPQHTNPTPTPSSDLTGLLANFSASYQSIVACVEQLKPVAQLTKDKEKLELEVERLKQELNNRDKATQQKEEEFQAQLERKDRNHEAILKLERNKYAELQTEYDNLASELEPLQTLLNVSQSLLPGDGTHTTCLEEMLDNIYAITSMNFVATKPLPTFKVLANTFEFSPLAEESFNKREIDWEDYSEIPASLYNAVKKCVRNKESHDLKSLLYISKVSDDKRGNIGEGAFALNLIKKHTVLGVVTGKYWEETDLLQDLNYITHFLSYEACMLHLHLFSDTGPKFFLEFANQGNSLRFINDPHVMPMESYDPDIDKSNVKFAHVIHKGWPHVVVFATCNIPQGTELLANYGPEYWAKLKHLQERHDTLQTLRAKIV